MEAFQLLKVSLEHESKCFLEKLVKKQECNTLSTFMFTCILYIPPFIDIVRTFGAFFALISCSGILPLALSWSMIPPLTVYSRSRLMGVPVILPNDITTLPARQPGREKKRWKTLIVILISLLKTSLAVFIYRLQVGFFMFCEERLWSSVHLFNIWARMNALSIYKVIRAMENRTEQTGVPSH